MQLQSVNTCSSRQEVPALVYLHFTSPESLKNFNNAFDGHVFVDQRGKEYKCTVEFAPFQNIPKKPQRPDTRQA